MSWLGILRLGLVQASLGAIIILTTSTLNRVMVVELALPAMLPGLLVALHHAVQMLRPRLGHASDAGRRRTPFILGGMALLGLSGWGAAASVAVMHDSLVLGLALAVPAFMGVGVGVGLAGTSLLALMAAEVPPARRAPAATIVWVMMIVGFALTATLAGRMLDPFSLDRLLWVTGGVSAFAVALSALALRGLEGTSRAPARDALPFRAALSQVWDDAGARRFTLFVFVSMLAYSAADLVLEPFAGEVWGRSIGQSTALAGLQNGGTLAGMALAGAAGAGWLGARAASLRLWMVAGCVASALCLMALAAAPRIAGFPLEAAYAALGLANGAFAAAAIASMMALAGQSRTGTRMGLWGAAQAIAFALGGFAGTVVLDLARPFVASPGAAYGTVFALEAALFLLSAVLALRLAAPTPRLREALA